MHNSSLKLMNTLLTKYIEPNSLILDFGGNNKHYNYKEIVINHNCKYSSLDWENADYIVKGYDWINVPKKYFDVVISGQVFEHDAYFWKSLENIKSVLKSKGYAILIMPSKGKFHQHPYDCYRFYPDSAIVFSEILNGEIQEIVWNSNVAKIALGEEKIKNLKINFNFKEDTSPGDLGIVIKLN